MIVIITGASKGLGKATAEKFAAAGHHLVLCARNAEALFATKEELTGNYKTCKVDVMPVDLSKKNDVLQFADFVLELGTPGVLINNAGSFLPGSIHAEKDGVLEKMMAANLYSAYHLSRFLLPAMMKAGSGHIFNMCSTASIAAYTNGGSYSLSKWALLGLTKNLREELKVHNIKVTAIIPGAVYTDSWKDSGIEPGRMMKPEDVANMVYAVSQLSISACVEEILLRPQLGDL